MHDKPTLPYTRRTREETWAWCSWHGAHSTGARLIHIVEQGSGPGASLYACAPCRDKHGLVPFADQR